MEGEHHSLVTPHALCKPLICHHYRLLGKLVVFRRPMAPTPVTPNDADFTGVTVSIILLYTMDRAEVFLFCRTYLQNLVSGRIIVQLSCSRGRFST